MIDHVFTDAIAALRDVLEGALLEPQAVEERLQVDMLGGDLSWQTTYSLPGEGNPPRVQADLTLDWSVWSQAAYRSWRLGDAPDELPRIALEVVFRVQRLSSLPDVHTVSTALPPTSAAVGGTELERHGPRVESGYDDDLTNAEHAVEVSYHGEYELDDATLADAGLLDDHYGALGGWIASTLVRLADLQLDFLPPDEEEATP
jgi:hypothetical protein